MDRHEYKVEVITEGLAGTLLLGASKLPVKRMETRFNELGRQGFEPFFQLVEKRRELLFWTREAVIVTFRKRIQDASQ